MPEEDASSQPIGSIQAVFALGAMCGADGRPEFGTCSLVENNQKDP
jgi:hypothetical protein